MASLFQTFKEDLFEVKANQAHVDIILEEDLPLNGEMTLQLRLKSSENKGILSAQVLDYGKKNASVIHQNIWTSLASTMGKISLGRTQRTPI